MNQTLFKAFLTIGFAQSIVFIGKPLSPEQGVVLGAAEDQKRDTAVCELGF